MLLEHVVGNTTSTETRTKSKHHRTATGKRRNKSTEVENFQP